MSGIYARPHNGQRGGSCVIGYQFLDFNPTGAVFKTVITPRPRCQAVVGCKKSKCGSLAPCQEGKPPFYFEFNRGASGFNRPTIPYGSSCEPVRCPDLCPVPCPCEKTCGGKRDRRHRGKKHRRKHRRSSSE